MKKTPARDVLAAPHIDPAILQGLFEAEHRPTHDQKWGDLEAGDAPFARAALTKARNIRDAEVVIDPGDAYLQGVADYRAAMVRQDLLSQAGVIVAEAFRTI